jgi:tRNA(Ile)-lysidine synthase
MNKVFQNIQDSLSSYQNSKILVAVSGGLDSMVLLNALKALNHEPIALHVNYHLRGEESDGDEAFIREKCSLLNIQLLVKNIPLAEVLDEEGGNLQNKARTERYDWFEKTAKQFGDAIVLLGHHKDDQIETFLLQLFRGAGMRGLSAMPKTRDLFVRPLLDINRSEILEFAKRNDIPWREDSSNSSLKYSRNKLRQEYIPLIENNIPTIHSDIIEMIKVFQTNYLTLQHDAGKIAMQVIHHGHFDIESLDAWNDEFLIEVLRQVNLPIQIHSELRKLAQSVNNKFIAIEHQHGNRIVKTDNKLEFVNTSEPWTPQVIIEKVNELPANFNKDFIYLDATKIKGSLRLRLWQDGDKIAPIGVKGSQLVSKILHDVKMSTGARENYHILCDDNEIHWCPGYKVGRNAIATSNKVQILKCSITCKESV